MTGLFTRVRTLTLLTIGVVALVTGLLTNRIRRVAIDRLAADSSVHRALRDGSSTRNGGSWLAGLIGEKYGLPVVWKDHEYPVKTYHGLIEATNAKTNDIDRYAPILAQEFLIYPPSFIKRSRLKRIVLCSGLSFAGQLRSAIPDFEHDTLYLDVSRSEYDRYQALVIHHEFFHVIDYRDDGQVYSDERWARLNPQAFRYGTGGVHMQGDPLSSLPTDRAGFLTTYATSGVEEDKAEMFAHMMVEYATVSERAARDKVVGDKVLAMRRLLKDFCSEVDESFWDGISRRPSLSR
jgi:hypothetical protein